MNIFELFETAKKKLKYPRLKYPFRNETITIFPTGPNSKHRGQLYVTDGKPYGENKLYCRVIPRTNELSDPIQLEWYRDFKQRDPELEQIVLDLVFKPTETAALHGQKFAYCCFCATMLTSKNSLKVGYGPICAENWGLPWGLDDDAAAYHEELDKDLDNL